MVTANPVVDGRTESKRAMSRARRATVLGLCCPFAFWVTGRWLAQLPTARRAFDDAVPSPIGRGRDSRRLRALDPATGTSRGGRFPPPPSPPRLSRGTLGTALARPGTKAAERGSAPLDSRRTASILVAFLITRLGSDINLPNMCGKLRPRPCPHVRCFTYASIQFRGTPHGDPKSLHPGRRRARSCTDARW
jgi:hypothetical protein